MEQNEWVFGDGGKIVSKEEMIAALGPGAQPPTFTAFGGPQAEWCAETWQSAKEPYTYGVYADGPVPFAVLLEDCPDLESAQVASSEVLARIILTCVGEGNAKPALHWRRDTGDEVAVVPTADTENGEIEWYGVTCLGGQHWQYNSGNDLNGARRTVAEAVLSYGLIDEEDEDMLPQDRRDLKSILALEAWATHVLAEDTRQRAQGVHGFLVGAEEVREILK
ncbi:hypothetical protein [Longispora urticae]